MRQLTANELICMSKLLALETHSLSLAKTSLHAASDSQLKDIIKAGITASESRIMGLQQFVSENNIVSLGEVQ